MARYCIIGTGFSGTCMLWHLVKAISSQTSSDDTLAPIEIFTIEQRRTNGPGLPYDVDEVESHHLCNNPAEKMSLFDNDFVDWMRANTKQLIELHPDLISAAHPATPLDLWCPEPATFYPRALFGVYLSHRFNEACTVAKSRGIQVHTFNGYEAINGTTYDEKFNLTIQNITTQQERRITKLDKVLLASGHWSAGARSNATVLPSPYPSSNIRHAITALRANRQEPALTVFVSGMGPSAVDAILSLCDSGKFELDAYGLAIRFVPGSGNVGGAKLSVVSGSRSGFFPGVRWPLVDYKFAFLTDEKMSELRRRNAGRIDLAALLALINNELRSASGNDLNLEKIITAPFKDAHQKLLMDVKGALRERLAYTIILRARRLRFYQDLQPDDKRSYDTELDSCFIRTAVPIPLQNARKLIALIEAGVLSTVALRDQGIQKGKPLSFAEIATRACTVKPDLVICANGQSYDLDKHPSQLIKQLIDKREVVVYAEDGYRPGGISASEASQFRVLNNVGGSPRYSSTLYSFGPITQYWQNQNNFAAAFVTAAEVVAKEWTTSAVLATRSAQWLAEVANERSCSPRLINRCVT